MTEEMTVPAVPTTPPQVTPPEQNGDKEGWTKDRSDQAKRAGQRAMLKTLGYADDDIKTPDGLQKALDGLKGVVAEHKTLKESAMSDAQKTAAALADVTTKLEAAEQRARDLETARTNDRLDAAITATAQAQRAEHPQDVVDLLRKGDLSGVLDDKGNVQADKVKALVDQARKDRPAWFQTGGVGSPSNRNGVAPEADAATKQAEIRRLNANLRNKF